MPKKQERMLMKEGMNKGLEGDRLNAYSFVYGILRKKFGWKPKRKKI